MLRNKLIDRLASEADIIRIESARCIKTKFSTCQCTKCTECCPEGAVQTDGGLFLDSKLCTECFLCVAECPSGAIDVNAINFYSVISKLRKVNLPVLGCNIKDTHKAHIHTFCLGYLSEEHLIALSVFIEPHVQFNLTKCRACRNSHIIEYLKKRLESISKKTSLNINKKVRLIENQTDLEFEDTSCDRRGFFDALKKLTVEGAANLFDNANKPKNITDDSDDLLPFKRKLLNKTLSHTSDKMRKAITRHYYYDIKLNKKCDMCFECTAVCHTGALKEKRPYDDDNNYLEGVSPQLLFNSSYCIGCGICSDFCLHKAMILKRGYSGNNLFDFNKL